MNIFLIIRVGEIIGDAKQAYSASSDNHHIKLA